jgi:hypothetical protein
MQMNLLSMPTPITSYALGIGAGLPIQHIRYQKGQGVGILQS